MKKTLRMLLVYCCALEVFAQDPAGQLIQANGQSGGAILTAEHTGTATSVVGVKATVLTANSTGVFSSGGQYGVKAFSNTVGTTRIALYGYANGGTSSFGVYGIAMGGSSYNWGGYFMGNTYCSSGAWYGSDEKLKKDITHLEPVLDKISKLDPVRYKYDSKVMNCLTEEQRIGFTAQNLEKVFPECVKDVEVPELDKDGNMVMDAKGNRITKSYKAVNYGDLIPVLLSAIQEQQKEIDDLKSKIK